MCNNTIGISVCSVFFFFYRFIYLLAPNTYIALLRMFGSAMILVLNEAIVN